MTPYVVDVMAALLTMAVWSSFVAVVRRGGWTARELTFWACFCASLSAFEMATHILPGTSLIDAGFAAWCAYHAWKRQKPRQRKPSKAAGRVRDLGHRLVVSRA
jgi:hypothetical protein